MGGKIYLAYTPGHILSGRTSGQELKKELEVLTVEEHCLLTHPQACVYLAYTTQDQPLTVGWTLPHQLAIKPILIATLTDSFVGVKMAVNVNEVSGLSNHRGATPCFCSCAVPTLAEGLQRCC